MDETARQSGASSSVILRVLAIQVGVMTVLSLVAWLWLGRVAGYSALLGGLTCVIPNAFLALRLVVPRRDPGAGALIRAAYIGELGKLGLTVLMFSLVFTLIRPLSGAALFAGFIVVQLMTFAGFLLHEPTTKETTVNEHGR